MMLRTPGHLCGAMVRSSAPNMQLPDLATPHTTARENAPDACARWRKQRSARHDAPPAHCRRMWMDHCPDAGGFDAGYQVDCVGAGMNTPRTDEFYIWSIEHNAWWRPNSRGYCISLLAAGRYS